MVMQDLTAEEEKLIRDFGAKPLDFQHPFSDYHFFDKGLFYSHREFDKYLEAHKKKKNLAIVSGFNASGRMHIGHTIVFETVREIQKKLDCNVLIPISDDESYLSGKVETQQEALNNSIKIAKQLIGFGFDPNKTKILIDQLYPEIYNYAIKYARHSTLSTVKAVYGYKNEANPGMFFYPFVQTAHILYPYEKMRADNVLVPIGIDEDNHIRVSRDIAPKFGFEKPAVIHSKFIPALDGGKMSKSKPQTAIFLDDEDDTIIKKVNQAITGGRHTLEEQRNLGGIPENCMVIKYLDYLYLKNEDSAKLKEEYRKGNILDKENKKRLAEHILNHKKTLMENSEKNLDKINKYLLTQESIKFDFDK
jgi:tryptophanyl-tRNA synthetase